MLKRQAFADFLPDLPLTTGMARNVWALPEGFRPVRNFDPITPALPGFLGGGAFVSSQGIATLLAGDATDLYRYSGTAWISVLDSLSASSWRFDQFGNLAVGVNGGAPVKYDLSGGTAALLDGDPPNADMVATVRNQLWLAGDDANLTELAISGFGDPEGWAAGTNQCLFVPFQSGGEIMGLAGGETGIVLQRRSVRRGTYTGDVTVWQFDEISQGIGCMAKGSVAASRDLVFFLSEAGFMVTDRNSVTPIGAEKIDRTFFSTYSREDIEAGITAAIDPRSTVVAWAMPGNPGRIWVYNWTLGKWTHIDTPLWGVFTGFTSNTSLDAFDAIWPGGLDTVPYSPDDSRFAGGSPLFMAVSDERIVGSFNGPNMAVTLATKPLEVEPGRRVRIRGARAISDAVAGTVTLDVRARAGDPPRPKVSGGIRANGRVPLRANGRHVGMQLDIPAGARWSYALGLDLEYEPEGAW